MASSVIKGIKTVSQNGVRITKDGSLVSIIGYMELPMTVPEGYRPRDNVFFPVTSSTNPTEIYGAIRPSGVTTVGNSGITTGKYFVSLTYLAS